MNHKEQRQRRKQYRKEKKQIKVLLKWLYHHPRVQSEKYQRIKKRVCTLTKVEENIIPNFNNFYTKQKEKIFQFDICEKEILPLNFSEEEKQIIHAPKQNQKKKTLQFIVPRQNAFQKMFTTWL